MTVRIGLAHFRVGETDGVSLEMDKWKYVLEQMGHQVMYLAGSKGLAEAEIIPELHYKAEWNRNIVRKAYDNTYQLDDETILKEKIFQYAAVIEEKVIDFIQRYKIDLLIVNNILSLGWNLSAGIGFANAIRKTKIKALAHHHDFHWERELYSNPNAEFIKKILAEYFPPKIEGMIHIVINQIAKKELSNRYGIQSIVVPNVFDFSSQPWMTDDYNQNLRKELGIQENDIVVLQATRIVERKGIELTLSVLKEINNRLERIRGKELYNGKIFERNNEIVFLMVGLNESNHYLQKLLFRAKEWRIKTIYANHLFNHSRENREHKKIYSLWDAYVIADIVSYPSLKEGFGNQFIEAAFAKKPMLVYEYPVFVSDLKNCGFDIISLGNQGEYDHDNLYKVKDSIVNKCTQQMIDVLTQKQRYVQMVDNNFAVAGKNFSYDALAKQLNAILNNSKNYSY